MYAKFLKRVLDFCLSVIAVSFLSPVLFLLTIIGAIAMKGNPFFTQKRPGRVCKSTGEEKVFSLIKFRTMTNAKDKDGVLLPDDKRLTKYGKFLRNTSLDELPELINIIKGDMALVGPRPLLVRDRLFMSDEQRRRHTVRPGLTGLAQVNGRNNIDWDTKLAFDLQYIEKISLLNDIKIVLKTFASVIKQSDVVRDGTASDMDYGDWLLQEGKISEGEYFDKLSSLNTEKKPAHI